MVPKIYSIHYTINAPPDMGAYVDASFRLPVAGIERRLIRFHWQILLADLTTMEPIPLEQNTVLLFYLNINSVTAQIANVVDPILIAPYLSGSMLVFFKPGQYEFSGLQTSQEFRFTFQYRNRDPVATIYFHNSFIIETEEKVL